MCCVVYIVLVTQLKIHMHTDIIESEAGSLCLRRGRWAMAAAQGYHSKATTPCIKVAQNRRSIAEITLQFQLSHQLKISE